MSKHEIKSFEITDDKNNLLGYIVCSCGKEMNVKLPSPSGHSTPVWIFIHETMNNTLNALCNRHVGVVIKKSEPGEVGHSHSFAFISKERQGADDNSRWRVKTQCGCGAWDVYYVTPVGNDVSECPGDSDCNHEMTFNFEIQRNYNTKRPGWKQFHRCTKCSKTTWDIEYHYK